MRKKIISLVLLSVLAAVLACGCGTEGASGDDGAEPAEIAEPETEPTLVLKAEDLEEIPADEPEEAAEEASGEASDEASGEASGEASEEASAEPGEAYMTDGGDSPPDTEEGEDTEPQGTGSPDLPDDASEDGSDTAGNPVHTHTYEAVVKSPTCTEPGYTDHVCSCGDSYRDSYTPALGHDYAAVVVAPTCTQRGYTYYACSRCGLDYVGDYTPTLPHDYAAVVLEPTCTAGGYTTYVCSSCGDTYIGDYTVATGHDMRYSADLSVAASCTEPGVDVRVCAYCGYTVKTSAQPLGHDYAVTVTEDGQTAVCSRCGDTVLY